jgi:phenylacetaldehyde dehydrogenase
MDASILNYSVNDNVAKFLASTKKLYINGNWVDSKSGKTFDVEDPATGKKLATCSAGGKEDIDLAVAAARKAFDSGTWSKTPPNERGKIIWKIGDLIDEHAEELAQLESLDNGKPVAVAGAADVALSSDIFRYMAGWATKIEGETIPISVPYTPGAQYHSYTLREPVGVVGQIIPWNFPLLMAAWKLSVALTAGCTIILKPAEQTPLSALRLLEIVNEAGILPEGVVNLVTGMGEEAGAPLAAHPQVDKVAFTGSTEVGKLITKAAAGNLKKVSLELGGKSPTIVFPDADIDAAIAGVASGIFFNHGQTCCAGSRLMAHEKVFDQVTEGISKIASNIKVGPGMDAATEMGPLVSAEQFKKVSGYIDAGKSDGGEIVAGGNYDNSTGGHFVHPTVFAKTNDDMSIVREEIFGPVLVAQPFSDSDLDKIAENANNTPYGLAASLWSKDISIAHKMAAKLRAGTIWINCHNIFDASLPFGGYKESGWGREMGHEVLHAYTELKAVTVNL